VLSETEFTAILGRVDYGIARKKTIYIYTPVGELARDCYIQHSSCGQTDTVARGPNLVRTRCLTINVAYIA